MTFFGWVLGGLHILMFLVGFSAYRKGIAPPGMPKALVILALCIIGIFTIGTGSLL